MESPNGSDLLVALSTLIIGFVIIEGKAVDIESNKSPKKVTSIPTKTANLAVSEPFRDTIYVVSTKGVDVEVIEAKQLKAVQVNIEVTKPITVKPKVQIETKSFDLKMYHEFFGSEKQIESFVRYIKTQSNDLDTKKGNIDNYYVIQVMLNRLKKNKCDWETYYLTNSINNSQTIRRMKAGKKVPNNSIDGNYKAIRSRLFEVLGGELPDSLTVPENLYYFHSHKTWKFARGIWHKSNYYQTHKHHFFTGN